MNAGNAGVGEPNTAVIDSLLGGSELEVSCEPCLILMPFAPQLRQLLLTWLAEQVQLQPSRAPRRLPLLLPAARRLAARLLQVLAKVLGLLQLRQGRTETRQRAPKVVRAGSLATAIRRCIPGLIDSILGTSEPYTKGWSVGRVFPS